MMNTKLPGDEILFTRSGGYSFPIYLNWWNFAVNQQFEPEHEEVIWSEFVRLWLARLSSELGANYNLYSDGPFTFVSDIEERRLALLHETGARSLRILTKFLDADHIATPLVAIVFSEAEAYSKYVYEFFKLHQADVVPPSQGMFLFESTYPHLVFKVEDDLSSAQLAFSHELTHYVLSYWSPAAWLEEGLATLVERDGQVLSMDYSGIKAIPDRIEWEDFWSGKAFDGTTGLDRELYELSYLLTVNLLQADESKFKQLVKQSTDVDGGVLAAQEIYGIDLNELAISICKR